MAALTAGVVMLGLLGLLELAYRNQRAREAQRHAWRLETLQARAAIVKGDDVELLKQRVQRLETKGLR